MRKFDQGLFINRSAKSRQSFTEKTLKYVFGKRSNIKYRSNAYNVLQSEHDIG